MDIEKAKQMMADAIKAMLECGEYKVTQTVGTRTDVGGQVENVICLIFGPSKDVLDVIAARIENASLDERVRDQ